MLTLGVNKWSVSEILANIKAKLAIYKRVSKINKGRLKTRDWQTKETKIEAYEDGIGWNNNFDRLKD